jgi:hypothetical protein
MIARLLLRPVLMLCAYACGSYSSSSIIASTFSRTASLILYFWELFITLDTVEGLTPAFLAISWIVALFRILDSLRVMQLIALIPQNTFHPEGCQAGF